MIYLYIILIKNNIGNKKKCRKLIRDGYVKVNGKIIVDIRYKVFLDDKIECCHHVLNTHIYKYYMFYKPKGFISANSDKYYPCVVDFFEEENLSIIGRLDIDTTGLMILTDDKSLMKTLMLPTNHIPKCYLVTLEKKLCDNVIILFKEGIVIDNDVKCCSSDIHIIDDYHCYLTIYEGKYHQVKKMFLSIGNRVKDLKRVSIGNLYLDDSLRKGEKRLLNDDEIKILKGVD